MPIKSLARGRNFTAGDMSRTVSQRWREALLDDRLRLTTRGQTVCRVPRKPRTTLIRLRLAMVELPNRHGTAGQDSHPKGVLAAVPSHVPDNGRDMSETLIVSKALSQHHAIHTHSRHVPTRLAASKWFEARQNALRSAAAFLTESGSPSLMQPASQ